MFKLSLKDSIVIFISVLIIGAIFNVSTFILSNAIKILLTLLIVNGLINRFKK